MKLTNLALLLVLTVVTVHACYSPYYYTDLNSTQYGVIISSIGETYLAEHITAEADLNNDGINDIVIASEYNQGYSNGRVYVVWGRNQSTWDAASIDFSTPDPSSWISIDNPTISSLYLGDYSIVVTDFNGDGIDDIVISSYTSYSHGIPVVFGHEGPWAASFSIDDIDGTNGIWLQRGSRGSNNPNWGSVLAAAGDINGDTYGDVIVGDYNSAMAFVYFGTNSTAPTLNADNFDGTNGFFFSGIANSYFGYGVAGGMDLNHDGIMDIAVGAYRDGDGDYYRAGKVYVLFGHNASDWPKEVYYSDTGSTLNGFAITGEFAYQNMGRDFVMPGDVNDDGMDDLYVVTYSNNAYVIFGHEGAWPSSLNIGEIANGTHGFMINAEYPYYLYDSAGSGRGDFNGDGIGDLFFGGPYTYVNGVYYAGAAFIVYGHSGKWDAIIDVSEIGGTVPGTIVLGEPNYYNNFGNSVSFGDVNNDGLADLVTGAPDDNYYYGKAIIVFGRHFTDDCMTCDITNVCSRCMAGSGLNNVSNTCTACDDHSWSIGYECHSCLQNNCEKCEKTSGICMNCSLGFEPITTSVTNCSTCTEQEYNTPVGQECVACMLGFGCNKCDMTTGNCRDCPAGKIISGTACSDCPEWSWSAGGNEATCHACTLDASCKKCDSHTGHCAACPEGHSLSDNCAACGTNQFSDGLSACQKCALDDGCTACNNADGMCTSCPAGMGLFGAGCVKCKETEHLVNKYCQTCALKNSCEECDVDTGACTKCPDGYIAWGEGCIEIPESWSKLNFTTVSPASRESSLLAILIITAALLVAVF